MWMFAATSSIIFFMAHGLDICPSLTGDTGASCVCDCSGLDDGDYQSCRGCHVYASCVAGRIYDNRPCPSNLVWDDDLKRCDFTSDTCQQGSTTTYKPQTTTTTHHTTTATSPTTATSLCVPGTTGPSCVCDCAGRNDGYYQLCTSCKEYLQCSKGQATKWECPKCYVWDDNAKLCLWCFLTCRLSGSNGCYGNPFQYRGNSIIGMNDVVKMQRKNKVYAMPSENKVYAMPSKNKKFLMPRKNKKYKKSYKKTFKYGHL